MKPGQTLVALMGIVYLLFAGSGLTANAQTREKGPWWPHPLWGAGD